MVLLVVSGGIGTLKTVLHTLKNARPCVVLADSGGAAWDIYDYCKNGRLPRVGYRRGSGAMVIDPDYIRTCHEVCPSPTSGALAQR